LPEGAKRQGKKILERVEPLLCNNREINIPEQFLGNGSENTFPQQQTRKQQEQRNGVFYVVRAEILITGTVWGN
jgi:hypothetical protein